MEKFRYGTKEIIATVLGVALIALAGFCEITLTQSGAVTPEVFEWVIPAIPIITIAAAFFGPVTGLFCGVGGILLQRAMFSSYIDYSEVITLGLFGFFVGMYFGKMHYDPRKFTMTTFLDFNAVQIMTGVFCAMFMLPMLRFMTTNANLYDSVVAGAKYSLGNAILVGLLCPAIMLIVSMVLGPKEKTRRS